MPVAVVTDSTSDIEPARARELGVAVVPLLVLWEGRAYRDYVDLSRQEFYRKLAVEPTLPVTSQPAPAMFEEAFAPHVAAGDPIVCIVVSAKLSGTINAAQAAARRFAGARIAIVDSQSVAGGLGMLVLRARELALQDADPEQIVADLEVRKRNQHLFGCLPDLSHLVRTGRIGRARAAAGTMMKIVPVLTLKDGEIVAQAQVRTFARAQETMLDLTMQVMRDPELSRLLVMHTNAPELAASVVERLRLRCNGRTPRMLETWEAGPVIATHGGSGAVGIFCSQDEA